MPDRIGKEPVGLRLPPFWHARHNFGIPYRPSDVPEQEDWYTVAHKFGVDVNDLIWFNFQTNNTDEVNWYLHHYVGCNKISPSGNNYMFSKGSQPGWIYIPPAEDKTLTFEAEAHCTWVPDRAKVFLQRLRAVSRGMSGHRGARIKKLVQVIVRVGYPSCLDLWYYNDMNITTYVDFKTTASKLRDMTKVTQGAFEFDGPSGLYSQSGTPERHRGMWRIHAVKDLFDKFACDTWNLDDLKTSLENIDNLMYKGWYEMTLVEFKVHQGGGAAFNDAVWKFIGHVRLLTKNPRHLYAAFG